MRHRDGTKPVERTPGVKDTMIHFDKGETDISEQRPTQQTLHLLLCFNLHSLQVTLILTLFPVYVLSRPSLWSDTTTGLLSKTVRFPLKPSFLTDSLLSVTSLYRSEHGNNESVTDPRWGSSRIGIKLLPSSGNTENCVMQGVSILTQRKLSSRLIDRMEVQTV